MTPEYESSVYDRKELIYHFADPERMYGHIEKKAIAEEEAQRSSAVTEVAE